MEQTVFGSIPMAKLALIQRQRMPSSIPLLTVNEPLTFRSVPF